MRVAISLFAGLCLCGVSLAQPAQGPGLSRLSCKINGSVTATLHLDAARLPYLIDVDTVAGSRECSLQSGQPAQLLRTEAWRFEWLDEPGDGARHRIDVLRKPLGRSSERYTLQLEPAGCGSLALPALMELAADDARCTIRQDREGAFVLFWRELRRAVLDRDGQRLQAMAVPQPAFAEGPDSPKAPSRLLAQGVRCVASLPGPRGRGLEQVLRSVVTPQDGLHFSTDSDSRRSIGDGLGVTWTPAGWRIDFLGGERAIFKQGC